MLIQNIIKSMSMISTYIFDWWKTSKVVTPELQDAYDALSSISFKKLLQVDPTQLDKLYD